MCVVAFGRATREKTTECDSKDSERKEKSGRTREKDRKERRRLCTRTASPLVEQATPTPSVVKMIAIPSEREGWRPRNAQESKAINTVLCTKQMSG